MIKNLLKYINNIQLVKRYPIIIQFVKFCLVGFTNLVIDYLVYVFFTRVFHLYYIIARVISFIIAVSWSFAINRRWTFQSDGNNLSQKYIKFFIANAATMVLNISLFYLAVDVLKIYDLLAIFIIAVIVSIFNFILNRFWAFNDK